MSNHCAGHSFAASLSDLIVKAVLDGADLLVFLQHHRHGFFLIQRDVAFTFAVRVIGQRLFQFLRQSGAQFLDRLVKPT